jgi:hypothetical protein
LVAVLRPDAEGQCSAPGLMEAYAPAPERLLIDEQSAFIDEET